ncbi:hypothetical protein EON63_22710 [archaeon]|nr:MAG: hypothetical protein EON63_22710 [archaeon]
MSPNLELVKVVHLPFQTLTDALHINNDASNMADISVGISLHAGYGDGDGGEVGGEYGDGDGDDDVLSPLLHLNVPIEKHKCMCWVDVSPRGQLGVSYKSGGIYVCVNVHGHVYVFVYKSMCIVPYPFFLGVYFFEAGRAGTVGVLSKLEVGFRYVCIHVCTCVVCMHASAASYRAY